MAEDKVITLRPNEFPNLIWENLIETYSMKNDSVACYDIESKIFNSIETYSMKKDFATCYDIESKIFNCREGTLSVTEYYETLNELWIELDQYQELKMCKADSIAYNEFLERVRRSFPLCLSEETRRSVMLDKGNSNIGSAMVIGKGLTKRSTSEGKPFIKRHTKDTCYKRYGKEKVLEQIDVNKGSTQIWMNQTTSDKENVVEHPSTLQLDQDIQAFIPQSIWILDSGAIDHMTLFPSYFTSYLKVSKRQLITVANRDYVPIAGSGNVQLHSPLSLHNELTTRRMIGVAKDQFMHDPREKHLQAVESVATQPTTVLAMAWMDGTRVPFKEEIGITGVVTCIFMRNTRKPFGWIRKI
ncbi:hypothetical protein CR513_41475, partial [Mucuna pruriens]